MDNLYDETIFLRKKYNKKRDKEDAYRNGNIETKTKIPVKNNQSGGTINTKKLDESNDAGKHATISKNVSNLIRDGRIVKKMKQADLANAINIKPSEVNDYESGKAIPNNQILAKMERKLGVKLRGKLN
jgi:putative transcription factor